MNSSHFPSRPPHPIALLKCTHCQAVCEISFPFPDTASYPESELNVTCHACSLVFRAQKNEISLIYLQSRDKPRTAPSSFMSKPNGRTGTDSAPLSMEFYSLLGIESNATQVQIKKAYYMKAMQYHPDKNASAEAEEKFKEMSEAYQGKLTSTILYDPQKRAHYNKYGKQLNADSSNINPGEFFKSQFGGDRFSDIIGELSLARDMQDAMSAIEGQAESLSAQQRQEIRQTRIATLASNLVTKLSLFTEAYPHSTGSEDPIGVTFAQIKVEALDSFKLISNAEAHILKTESHGADLLKAIGYTYVLKAHQSLAKIDLDDTNVLTKAWGFGSRITTLMREKAHIVSETVGAIKSAVAMQSSMAKLQQIDRKVNDLGEGVAEVSLSAAEEEMKRKLETDAATIALDALWRGSKLEVESVLREVCEAVLEDVAINREVRVRRCEALVELGLIYQAVGSEVVAK